MTGPDANLPRPKTKTREEIAQAYRSEPWWYDVRGFFILTFAYNDTLGNQLRFFGPNFGPRHLELACGTGTLLELLLRWRRWKGLPETAITGVDYAESMLAGARHRFRRQPALQFEHADAAQLPYEDQRFDTINIANALHCFPDVRGALRDAHRVLRPGGTLAVNTLLHPRGPWPLKGWAQGINAWGMRKGILVTPYDADQVRALVAEAGFRITFDRMRGNCLDLLLTRD